MKRLLSTLAAAALLASGAVQAQDTKIKFQLDWRFEGPSALFLAAKAKETLIYSPQPLPSAETRTDNTSSNG